MVSPAFLHINCQTGYVKRYTRNQHNKVWVTHQATITPGALGLQGALELFRTQPQLLVGQPKEAA